MKARKKKSLSVTLTIQALILFLPTISRRICQSFRCSTYDQGEYEDETYTKLSYLDADMGIDCNTTKYRLMLTYAGAMVLVFPLGIPLLTYQMLYKNRHDLNPRKWDSTMTDEEVEEKRKESIKRHPIGQIATLYKPNHM